MISGPPKRRRSFSMGRNKSLVTRMVVLNTGKKIRTVPAARLCWTRGKGKFRCGACGQ